MQLSLKLKFNRQIKYKKKSSKVQKCISMRRFHSHRIICLLAKPKIYEQQNVHSSQTIIRRINSILKHRTKTPRPVILFLRILFRSNTIYRRRCRRRHIYYSNNFAVFSCAVFHRDNDIDHIFFSRID